MCLFSCRWGLFHSRTHLLQMILTQVDWCLLVRKHISAVQAGDCFSTSCTASLSSVINGFSWTQGWHLKWLKVTDKTREQRHKDFDWHLWPISCCCQGLQQNTRERVKTVCQIKAAFLMGQLRGGREKKMRFMSSVSTVSASTHTQNLLFQACVLFFEVSYLIPY